MLGSSMRQLTFSLLLSVITASLGLGWLLSQVYDHFNGAAQIPPKLAAFQSVAVDLANTADELAQPHAFFELWQKHAHATVSLHDFASFPVPSALASSFRLGRPLLLEADGVVSVYVYMPNSEVVMAMDVPASPISTSDTPLPLILTVAFYLSMALILAIWLYPLIKHLDQLRSAAKRFGGGDMSARVLVTRHSYICEIEQEFNAMAERIAQLINDNKLLSRAVSHDLKTPLARLRFGLDTLAEEHEDEQRQIYAERLNRDLDEMESLVSTLLEYARLDQASIQLQPQSLDLHQFVQRVIAQRPGVTIHLADARGPAIFRIDPRYLAMQVNSVLDNALKYARALVTISISSDHQWVSLVIEDDGPGIAEEQRARVLLPFQRGEAAGRGVGHGMGLAIADKIAKWFRGELHLGCSASLGGARITLRYPLTEAPG